MIDTGAPEAVTVVTVDAIPLQLAPPPPVGPPGFDALPSAVASGSPPELEPEPEEPLDPELLVDPELEPDAGPELDPPPSVTLWPCAAPVPEPPHPQSTAARKMTAEALTQAAYRARQARVAARAICGVMVCGDAAGPARFPRRAEHEPPPAKRRGLNPAL
jgi:hypothetical protein